MKSLCCITVVLILLFCLFTGCAKENNDMPAETCSPALSTDEVSKAETISIETFPPQETESIAEAPQHLNVEAGAYQLHFDSKKSDEYLDYYLFIPDNAAKNMPIVVFLHGSVEIGHVELLEKYGIVSVVEALYGKDFPFLLLLPCTHKPSWTGNSVPETLIELIDEVAESYYADKERIMITGHSLGSVGTWKMVSLYSDYFSAAVPISCGIDEPINFDNCAKVPIMAFAGTVGADEKNYNPAMQKLVVSINDAGGEALMCVIDGADHEAMVTAAYTTELFNWMLSQ